MISLLISTRFKVRKSSVEYAFGKCIVKVVYRIGKFLAIKMLHGKNKLQNISPSILNFPGFLGKEKSSEFTILAS